MNYLGWLRNEIEERRLWLLVVAVGAAFLVGSLIYDPVQKVENDVVEPAGRSVGIPLAPSGFNVLHFCEQATSVIGGEDPHIGGDRYVAQDGLAILDWPDAPVGKNHIARYYPNENESEAVEMTTKAEECMKRRASE